MRWLCRFPCSIVLQDDVFVVSNYVKHGRSHVLLCCVHHETCDLKYNNLCVQFNRDKFIVNEAWKVFVHVRSHSVEGSHHPTILFVCFIAFLNSSSKMRKFDVLHSFSKCLIVCKTLKTRSFGRENPDFYTWSVRPN